MTFISVCQYLRGPVLGGDQFVWMNLASWHSNGHALYREVWDHKDPGLQMIYLLADELGGTTPLRLFGVVAAVISLVSVYFMLRWEISTRVRLVASPFALAMLWSLVAFSSPTWLYTYTEHFATAAFLAGLVLIQRRALSGLLFGVAVVVKLSFLVPALFVILFVARRGSEPAERSTSPPEAFGTFGGAAGKVSEPLREAAPLLLGLSAVVAAIGGRLAVSGSLEGWWEVVQFNSRYAVVRREGATWLDSIRISVHASPIGVVNALICLSATALVANYVVRQRHSMSNRRFELVSSAFLGVGLMSLLQVPLDLHHWYPAVALSLLVIVSHLREPSFRFAGDRLGRVTLSALMAASLALGSIDLLDQPAGGREVHLAEIPGFETLKAESEPVSILMIGSNLAFLPIAEAVPDARLSCRFLVWFWWVEELNADEIASCLNSAPDLVIVMDDGKFGPLTAEFVRNLGQAGFSRCRSATAAALYVSPRVEC